MRFKLMVAKNQCSHCTWIMRTDQKVALSIGTVAGEINCSVCSIVVDGGKGYQGDVRERCVTEASVIQLDVRLEYVWGLGEVELVNNDIPVRKHRTIIHGCHGRGTTAAEGPGGAEFTGEAAAEMSIFWYQLKQGNCIRVSNQHSVRSSVTLSNNVFPQMAAVL